MKELLKKEGLKFLIVGCTGAMIALLSQIAVKALPVYKSLKQVLTKDLLLLLNILLTLIMLLCLVTLYRLLSKKLKYGIYWDKRENPYCPACKTPLNYLVYEYEEEEYFHGFCSKCNKRICLDPSLTRTFKSVEDLRSSI